MTIPGFLLVAQETLMATALTIWRLAPTKLTHQRILDPMRVKAI